MIAVRPAWDLLPRDAESVVAVSGGPDSTALLVAAAPRRRIVAAHFNHALRGAEADADAAFVAELAGRLGVPFVTERADPPAGPDENRARNARYAFLLRVARARGCPVVAVAHTADDQAETFLMRLIRGSGTLGLGAMAPSRPLVSIATSIGTSVSAAAGLRAAGPDAADGDPDDMGDSDDIDGARDERRLAAGRDGDRVASRVWSTPPWGSASTAWPSGSGSASAAPRTQTPAPGTAPSPSAAPPQTVPVPNPAPGPVSRAVPNPVPVFLVRPFLTVTRAEVLAYLQRKRVGYRVDQSNFDTTRFRARIRAELLPQLRTYNPRIVEVLCRTAAHLREDQQALEAMRAVGAPGAPGGP